VISWILSFDEALNGEKKTGSWNYERDLEKKASKYSVNQ